MISEFLPTKRAQRGRFMGAGLALCLAFICQTALAANCTTNADCDDGLFCNGAEQCVLGECEDAFAPCTEDQTCNESTHECLDPGEEDPPPDDPGDDEPEDEPEDEPGTTVCSYLGDNPNHRHDRDVWIFTGNQGETVDIFLQPDGENNDGEVRLILRSHRPNSRQRLYLDEHGRLDLEINTTLPWTGTYRVVVRDTHGGRHHRRPNYEGGYCLTVVSSDGSDATLDSTENVEGEDEGAE